MVLLLATIFGQHDDGRSLFGVEAVLALLLFDFTRLLGVRECVRDACSSPG